MVILALYIVLLALYIVLLALYIMLLALYTVLYFAPLCNHRKGTFFKKCGELSEAVFPLVVVV